VASPFATRQANITHYDTKSAARNQRLKTRLPHLQELVVEAFVLFEVAKLAGARTTVISF